MARDNAEYARVAGMDWQMWVVMASTSEERNRRVDAIQAVIEEEISQILNNMGQDWRQINDSHEAINDKRRLLHQWDNWR